MKRIAFRVVPALALLVAGYVWVSPLVSGQASPMPSTRNGEWPMYTSDLRGSKYSPLDQINGTNFSKMEVAWRLKTDNFGPRPETKLEGTPIMVKGMLYATAGTRRAVVAVNPATGEIKWSYSLDEGERATRWAPRQLSGRGLSFWTDGKGDDRVIYVTTGYRLVSLNAKTGQPVAGFGSNGIVDLKQGIIINGKQADLEKSEIGLHSTPTVVNDTILVGSSMFEGLGYEYATNVQGQARAFDARTGKLLWSFHGIPKRGEFGFDTWKNESAGYTGNNGVWTQITADLRGSKYSPLDQINGTNFSKLEVAWRLKTDNFGPRPETKLEGTPIMVKGMLYATAGTRRAVVALNPVTGEIKWTYSLDEGERATRWAQRQL